MINKIDFFHLYYPSIIADSCCFFNNMNGIYVDLPGIIKEEHKNVKYENSEKIKFQDAIYLKVNTDTIINLDIPSYDDKFYYGIINISDNNEISFLYWFNCNNKFQVKKIKKYLKEELNINIKEGSSKNCLTAVWSNNEK